MAFFRPDIGDHNRHAVATKRVTKHVSKLSLPVRNVVALFIT